MVEKYKIFIGAGGTGGHIFPAIAIYKNLNTKGISSLFFTDFRAKKYNLPENIVLLRINNYSYNFVAKLLFLKNLVIDTFKCIYLIIKYKPKLILSFGGYPTLPLLIASVLLAKKIILHEQNSLAGKVNILFAKFAFKILWGFKNISNLKKYKYKSLYTGVPIRNRRSLSSIKKSKSIQNNLNITVLGGSQGSNILGKQIAETICNFSIYCKGKSSATNILLPLNISLVHQVTANNLKNVKNIYKSYDIKATIAPFFTDVHNILNNTDILISRAGAGTIADIIYWQIPSILIPFKQASNDHQTINAQYLSNLNLSFLIKQDDLTQSKLLKILIKLISKHYARMKEIKSNLKKISVNSNEIITAIVCQTLKNQK